ncbi:hypothetical protein Acr_00g0041360 [Actinidia rufa]|uniref:Uncharacterized protein n=1 Tax=Actinidia rufa TaxID=165716 RepID=A0A7J0DI40_9ERIC|nr:hypothetical protein Acr_00g0041360 [Actinidia rufa]
MDNQGAPQGQHRYPNQTQANVGNYGQASSSYHHQQVQGQGPYAPPPSQSYALQGPPPNSSSYQPPHKRNFEDTVQVFMQSQQTTNAQIVQNFVDIKAQLSKLTTTMGALQQEREKFPSQPQVNPQGQYQVSSSNGFEPQMEHLKAINTLRSGKEIDKTILPKPYQDKAPPPSTSYDLSVEPPSGDTDKIKRVVVQSNKLFPISALFPQWLKAPKRQTIMLRFTSSLSK